jgi:hypothetical protein
LIHFQGGGWCINEQDCVGRSKTALGSSSSWNRTQWPSADGGPHGLFGFDAASNPFTHNWNHVFIGYCDGASYAGDVQAPVVVGASSLHFRGRAIRDAVVDTLGPRGMGQASDVILTGCSAGGLATYLHADTVHARLNASTRFVAAPSAGFFLDVPSFGGNRVYTPNYQYVFHMQNVSGAINQACVASRTPTGDAWRCFMAPYTVGFVRAPLFIINSLYDSWQWYNIMALGCDPRVAGQCNASQLSYFVGYRAAMLQNLTAAGFFARTDSGAYLLSCLVHVVSGVDAYYAGPLKVEDQTMVQTFMSWYNGGGAASVAVDGPWGTTAGNPSCPPNTAIRTMLRAQKP